MFKGLGIALLFVVALVVAACAAPAPAPTTAPTSAAKPAATTAPTTAPTVASPTAAVVSTPATAAATKPGATGIPQIPASHQPIAQRQDCLACHKQQGFMPAPASHAGRAGDTCSGCHQAAAATTPPVLNLVSAKAAKAPVVDAQVDDVWSKAKPLAVHVDGGINQSETDVVFKSVYTQDSIFFLAQYKDPTESLRRQPWVKQQDGSWKSLPGSEAYEDKFAMIWNVRDSIKDFNTQGCAVTCHATTTGRDRPLKYTNAPGEIGDIWHAKTVRTIPVGQIDAQYVDDDQKSPEAGRKSDPKTAGGYADNKKEGANTPVYGLPNNKPAPPYWILDSEKVPFDDSKYKPGDEVPGIIIAPFAGERGDLLAKAVWKDGMWTLEFGHKLVADSKTDVQFTDLTKPYHFGTAVFDNAQIGHAVQFGVTKLTFEK